MNLTLTFTRLSWLVMSLVAPWHRHVWRIAIEDGVLYVYSDIDKGKSLTDTGFPMQSLRVICFEADTEVLLAMAYVLARDLLGISIGRPELPYTSLDVWRTARRMGLRVQTQQHS